jgi:uncharacterized membrane protein
MRLSSAARIETVPQRSLEACSTPVPRDPLFIVAVLAACVVVSEWMTRRTWLRHLGTALVVIVVTAVVANLGVIPTGTDDVPLYGVLFREVAWMAIFWLLLQVRLREVARAGPVMIALFALGALGTALGAVAGMLLVGGAARFGEVHAALAGMFAATYTGGSANFIAIASQYQVTDGLLLASANAIDAAMTTVWMAATVVIPRLLRRTARAEPSADLPRVDVAADVQADTESLHPLDLSATLAFGALAVWGSQRGADWLASAFGVEIPAVLLLTTAALILAQVPAVARLRGPRSLGLLGVYLFLAVIGALCDVEALRSSGALGLWIFLFVLVLLAVHAIVVFGAAALLRLDPDLAAVASQANIGGSTSALALARSLGRGDLVLPGILVGSLGNAVGTYIGVAVVVMLS